ncbi:hypothetical protein [Sinomonas terrae]|uniref:OB domain-containing protein n=1 Tax=Sinomonas terrae TaxID=2908838 RepID=A0ABS9TZM0_9MICC|nr:hypothetical protein [Sinomonas terrae]MCH6469876.1 hypothetical protein [Sinomonas terrae]
MGRQARVLQRRRSRRRTRRVHRRARPKLRGVLPRDRRPVARAISRSHGWVSASAAYDRPSTRTLVSAYLFGNTPADVELRREAAAPEIPSASEKVKEIIHALLEGLEGDGDYVTNLKALLRARYTEGQHLGIVVSAVAAYERMVGDLVRKEVQAKAQAESEYAGTVGEKTEVTGKVARLQPVENTFGYTTTTSMLVIIEAGTTVAKMFTAAAWAFGIERGDEITVAGTVKAHEEYNGVKQTALARPKLVSRTASSVGLVAV